MLTTRFKGIEIKISYREINYITKKKKNNNVRSHYK